MATVFHVSCALNTAQIADQLTPFQLKPQLRPLAPAKDAACQLGHAKRALDCAATAAQSTTPSPLKVETKTSPLYVNCAGRAA